MNETELKTALDELKQDREKFNYVFARSSGLSIEAALKDAGRSKAWFYTLPDEEQKRLEMLACELNAASKFKARQIIDDAVVEAAGVKVSGLRSRNENVKQTSATEILDRVLGKPNQPLTGEGGGPVAVKVIEVVLPPGDSGDDE